MGERDNPRTNNRPMNYADFFDFFPSLARIENLTRHDCLKAVTKSREELDYDDFTENEFSSCMQFINREFPIDS